MRNPPPALEDLLLPLFLAVKIFIGAGHEFFERNRLPGNKRRRADTYRNIPGLSRVIFEYTTDCW